jgi:hypothetical protein
MGQETAELKEGTNPQSIQSLTQQKIHVFEELFVGDCTMEKGATLLMKNDKTGSFDARLRSADSNDTWFIRFELLDDSGNVVTRIPNETTIFGQPKFWVYSMSDQDTWYDWHIDFAYDSTNFDKISNTITSYYDC